MNSNNYNNSYPNFVQGQTLDPVPYSITIPDISNDAIPHPNSSQQPKDSFATTSTTATPTPTLTSQSHFDPLLPPTVKLSMLSAADGDGRYILSRLRDHRIFANVRLYLAYLHDKSDTVCIDGKTKTNLIVSIHQEGLPTGYAALRQIFDRYHESFGVESSQVTKDLTAFASHLNSKRTAYLQKIREDSDKFFRPLPGQQKKKCSFW